MIVLVAYGAHIQAYQDLPEGYDEEGRALACLR